MMIRPTPTTTAATTLLLLLCQCSWVGGYLPTTPLPSRNGSPKDFKGGLKPDLRRPGALRAVGSAVTPSNAPNSARQLLPSDAYDTILRGEIAVVPNFLPPSLVSSLRADAISLYRDGHFSADALAAYGTEQTTKFDPAKDRTVLKLAQWKRTDVGDANLRHSTFGSLMGRLRSDLAHNLNRPNLDRGISTTAYGAGSTEISYTRFGPGAYLKRHIDEHHEELKGRRGWEKPTRRSVSWLVYLNDGTWKPEEHGGCLRVFQRRVKPVDSQQVGARENGDLQIGWLRSVGTDPVERPVFLDARRSGKEGNCALYTVLDENVNIPPEERKPIYISGNFNPDPVLFLSGGDFFAQKLLIDNPTLAPRFHFLEPPRSAATKLMATVPTPSAANDDEVAMEIPPLGGTLVLFDSVTLPHEVLPSVGRERWATSGWFHEDQQPEHEDHLLGSVASAV